MYWLAFFVFWALAAGACWVGLRLAGSAARINASEPWSTGPAERET